MKRDKRIIRRKTIADKSLTSIADFLFEAEKLSTTPRSGFTFLGAGSQSVAEHTASTAFVGYALAKMSGKTDASKVVMMCLMHDLHEARTSDLNYMNQRYVKADAVRATDDATKNLFFGEEIRRIFREYEMRNSLEAKLAKDADQIELLLNLKRVMDLGHKRASSWIPPILKRLLTPEGKKLAKTILVTDSDDWWFDKKSRWWINRDK